MSVAQVYACDHLVIPASTYGSGAQPCPNTSRPAGTATVLRVVAARDGWAVDGDGRHLFPDHARPDVNDPRRTA